MLKNGKNFFQLQKNSFFHLINTHIKIKIKETSFKYKMKKLILNARPTMLVTYNRQQKQLTYQQVTRESFSSHYPSMTILFLRVNLVILTFLFFQTVFKMN